MLVEVSLLFLAGIFGGILNSIAGGGTFITFPALLFAGVPPISANATNTFASCSGYISGAYAFREELRSHLGELPVYIAVSLFGGVAGAWLLLKTPEALFREVIPWLLLFATLLFASGSRLSSTVKSIASGHRYASRTAKLALLPVLLAVCIYGGFFNAGLGIIILAYLSLSGHSDINAMNGLKLLVSTCVSLVAIAVFIYNGAIQWFEGSVVLLGAVTGGYFAARISRRLPPLYIRNFIILAGAGMTLYFFYDIYLS